MGRRLRTPWVAAALLGSVVLGSTLRAQNPPAARPILYVIGTAHLDSQWNWTVQDTIRRYVAATFLDNFKLFERFPRYAFNYEGAIHYMWFKEYYPEAWPELQKYVASGRWRLSGSWINAADVNVPSPESLMRQALYGKRFFRQEFNKTSQDVYLPDCFGFGFALPSIAAHSGLMAFSTQKLTWGSSVPIPFPIGRWKGVDGSEVVAALNPRDYVTKIRSDVSVDPKWSDDLTPLGNGRLVGFRYFGTGDVGEAPDLESVDWLEKAIGNRDGRVEVRTTSADQLSRDLSPGERAALPRYEGELTMKTHGVGCYTSQAAMKRFNRMNELLADAAERAAVAAEWLTGSGYPSERLREAWLRVLWHQFHDDLTGTSIPQAYGFSWNDELTSANQFAAVLERATGDVARNLDTRGDGVPLVVYNPLSSARRDPVDATVQFAGAAPSAVQVIDRSSGKTVAAQVLRVSGREARVIFLAELPAVGFKVFDVGRGPAQARPSALSITTTTLENARYRVRIDGNGDIASVVDKDAGRELLAGPIRLEMRNDPSPDKPAWRILWDTVNSAPREIVASPVVRIVERGPVRVALEITRKAAGSTIVQRVSLVDGGDRVDVENLVDWRSLNTLLKASFPFAASNAKATYDLGLGTIERGNNTPEHYEVPAQKWADLTDASGAFGAAVLNDSKYGWDKPADNVLRLTLLHTPLPKASAYQRSQDIGSHRFVYSVVGHRGDWRAGSVPASAAALNQPLVAFQTIPHAGALGRGFSLLSLESAGDQVAVVALKKAEDSDELVLRLQERYGRSARARLRFAGPVVAAREINAAEEPVGPFAVGGEDLVVDLAGYQPRTLAVRLRPRGAGSGPAARPAIPLDLPFNLDGISTDANRADGDFDGKKQTLAAELLPKELVLDGIPFRFGSTAPGASNVVVARGQRISIPATCRRLSVVAAAVGGDVPATFAIRNKAGARVSSATVIVREWEGPVGRWFTPLKDTHLFREVYVAPMRGQSWTQDAIQAELVVSADPATGAVSGLDQIRPAFVKRDEIAWAGTHRHAPDGNEPYVPSYLFAYTIVLPPGAHAVQLPDDGRLRILAISASDRPPDLKAAGVLYARDLPEPKAALEPKAQTQKLRPSHAASTGGR